MNKKALLPIVLIAGIATGWHFYRQNQEQTGAHTLYGNVDIREVNTSFRVGGRLDKVLVDEGDTVTQGQVIAQLDPAPREVEVAQARAKVQAVEAKLAMLTKGYREEDIAQARARVGETESAAENAQKVFARQEQLFKTGAVSRQNYDDARAARDEANERLRSARASLSQLESGYRTEEVDQARAELAGAQAEMSATQLALQDTTLHAPSAGTVLTRVVEPGTLVQAGNTILTLSLNTPVYIRAYVDEPRLGEIKPGMQVEIETDSAEDLRYTGQIGFISPRTEFTPKSVETPELRTSLVYRLRIVVQDPQGNLRQGMPVTIHLPHGEVPNSKSQIPTQIQEQRESQTSNSSAKEHAAVK